ncbi:hypothetical protein THAOC_17597, partial [Thalassiosira oceanica]
SDCNPNPDHTEDNTIREAIQLSASAEVRANGGAGSNRDTRWGILPEYIKEWIKRKDNPSSNLPEAEMTPFSAWEVVEAVKFARDNGYKLSIKNSGHRAGTLLLGMKRMPRLSSGAEGIVTCDLEWSSYPILDPCRLAAARGKPGYVQIGGGENFAEVYTSVRNYNEDQDKYKFQAFGGASATVSPFGYSMMGGLSGTTGGRRHGFGADQILMAEMVSLDFKRKSAIFFIFDLSSHRSFLPGITSGSGRPIGLNLAAMNCTLKLQRWRENAATNTMVEVVRLGNRAPKMSHSNSTDSGGPSEDGGGGWGVVISMSQQLHTYEQFGEFNFRDLSDPNCQQLDVLKSNSIAQVFWNKYYLDDDYFVNSNANTRFPAEYEVGPAKSDDTRTFNDMRTACSTPSVVAGPMFCDGEGYAERALKTYHTFLDNWNEIVEDEGYGDNNGVKFADDAEKKKFKDCASEPSESDKQNLKAWIDVNKAGGGGKPNRFNDDVKEEIKRWEAQPLVDGTAARDGIPGILLTYMAFGPGTMNGSDGMDSVSRAMRIAGTWSGLPLMGAHPFGPSFAVYDDNFFVSLQE